MKVIRYPKRESWPEILRRPQAGNTTVEDSVRAILKAVRSGGDEMLRAYTKAFDGADVTDLLVAEDSIDAAVERVPVELKAAIQVAASNIEKFHIAQRDEEHQVETTPGVICWRRSIPIERVGLYVPAGTAPLFSTVLMLGIPAKLAGCREVVLCSPPDQDGRVADVILYAARFAGITKVYKVGGAQAVAAMAYGTETIPPVYKIFGPGNQFVTCAKQMVSIEVAIDMPAGPSEVAVVADDSCVPRFVAADLLSQAEHGPDSQVLLVVCSEKVLEATLVEIERQLIDLPRREIAKAALANSTAILVGSVSEGIEISNEYAPEHLILAVSEPAEASKEVLNAGSVFLGNYSCESAGDYASGTNHTLPTGGSAKAFSGVSLDSFLKKITFQNLTADGLRNLGPTIECMAAAEGLEAHRRAIAIRTTGGSADVRS